MKISLVTCFNADWQYGRVPSPYIPLNLLCLAACLRNSGHHVEIVDQTLALIQGKVTDGPQFHQEIAELIHTSEPDVVGFTTMCNSYPQTLTLARFCREIAPDNKIILGGPQATAVDVETLRAFPWVDAIVRGEADYSLPTLLHRWEVGQPYDDILGVTWRGKDARIHRTEAPPLLQDLSQLPFPAYDLYPIKQFPASMIPLEAGRGCPFECTFCSTNLFFSRRYRIKTPERLVSEMVFLNQTYGYTDFDLVHDMLTVDRRWVQRFARTLIDGGHSFHWGCSARVDCVTPELLAEMAQAGCLGIFFGVETGSQRLQPIIEKKLDVSQVLPTVQTCVEQGMSPTASMITGFPDETVDDAMESLHMALDVLHLSPETRGQMHMLAPLVGSPLYAKHKDELQFDGHSSDISLFMLTPQEIATVRSYPDVFPNFYYIPTPHVERDFTKAVSAALYTCPGLLIILRHAGVELKSVLLGWVAWQHQHVAKEEIDQDYYLYYFGLDFVRYLREEIAPDVASVAPYFEDCLAYFEAKYRLQRGHKMERTLYFAFDYDVVQLNKLARTNAPWPTFLPQPTGILFVNLAVKYELGFAYLEVSVPQEADPAVRIGDEVEVPDLFDQLRSLPKLLMFNKTQKRLFMAKHHMTPQILRAIGLAA